jgi:hypothetical protein
MGETSKGQKIADFYFGTSNVPTVLLNWICLIVCAIKETGGTSQTKEDLFLICWCWCLMPDCLVSGPGCFFEQFSLWMYLYICNGTYRNIVSLFLTVSMTENAISWRPGMREKSWISFHSKLKVTWK